MPVLPDGRVSGRPTKKFSKLKTFTGRNLEECNQLVEKFLNE